MKGKGETRLAPEVLQTRLKTWDSLFPRNIKLAGVICLRVSLYRLPRLIWNCASNKMLNWERTLCFGSNGARCLFIIAVSFVLLLFHTGGFSSPFTKMSSTSIPQDPHWGREPKLQPPLRSLHPGPGLALCIPGRQRSRDTQGHFSSRRKALFERRDRASLTLGCSLTATKPSE